MTRMGVIMFSLRFSLFLNKTNAYNCVCVLSPEGLTGSVVTDSLHTVIKHVSLLSSQLSYQLIYLLLLIHDYFTPLMACLLAYLYFCL